MAALDRFVHDPQMTWLKENLPRATAVLIGPRILHAGAESSEMVAVVLTDKALNSFLSNSFKLGGDVSVAAGPVGVGTAAPVTVDMVVYVRARDPGQAERHLGGGALAPGAWLAGAQAHAGVGPRPRPGARARRRGRHERG